MRRGKRDSSLPHQTIQSYDNLNLDQIHPMKTSTNPAIAALRYHITGAIERGEAQAIAGIPYVPAPFTPADLLARVQATPAGRSAWSRAVHTYAVELVESLTESDDLSNETLLRKALLNGADNWQQYSEGGCALVYDADIAERVCSPSELKRVKGGERQPNARENWLECQARALAQAAALVRRAYAKAAAIEGGAL